MAGMNNLTVIPLQVNSILQSIMFIALAIPFGGGTGAKNKRYDGYNSQAKQKLLHTF